MLSLYLQCFDAVGWAAGRASGLWKTEWWGAGMVICLEWGVDLHMAQLMPLPLIVSCFSIFQIGFTFLVLAHLGTPRKGPLNGCVCATVHWLQWCLTFINIAGAPYTVSLVHWHLSVKKVKVAHTRLPSIGSRSWSWFLVVSLQVMWVINPAVGCHYFLPVVTLTTLKRAATNFTAWWIEAWWVWIVCLRLLPDSVVAAIWTQAFLRLSPAR